LHVSWAKTGFEISSGTLIQVVQFMRTGEFKRYDLEGGNFKKYGSDRPPFYSVSDARVPLMLLYGESDQIVPSRVSL